MSSGWGCPHEDKGRCRRRDGEGCDPGAGGCVLEESLHRAQDALRQGRGEAAGAEPTEDDRP